MKIKNSMILLLCTLTAAQCLGMTKAEAEEILKRQFGYIGKKNIPTAPTKKISHVLPQTETEEVIEAIKYNNKDLFIDLVESRGINLKDIDATNSLTQHAVEAFRKDKKDLFILFYLLANGIQLNQDSLDQLEKVELPDKHDQWQKMLAALKLFNAATTPTDKTRALNAALDLSYPFNSSHNRADIKKLKELIVATHDEPFLFPTAPQEFDEELAEFVFVPTPEEEKAQFKKILEEEGENPDEWEFMRSKEDIEDAEDIAKFYKFGG
jgi:hypothetical protein